MIKPMLARVYDPSKHTIGPHFIQPKLDGVRCLADINHGKVTLTSRSGKPIRLPHLRERLKNLPTMVLDGELYIHGKKFQDIQGIINSKNHPDKDKIQYHVYDVVRQDLSFEERRLIFNRGFIRNHVYVVKTRYFPRGEGIDNQLDIFTGRGYEGIMIRLLGMPYVFGRSDQLLKYKRWHEEEFTVLDILEGKGKNAGTAIFVCSVYTDGVLHKFRVTAPGTYEEKRRAWEHGEGLGQELTVKFQEKTNKGIPRFPIALGFKEDR